MSNKLKTEKIEEEEREGGTRHERWANCPGDCSCNRFIRVTAATPDAAFAPAVTTYSYSLYFSYSISF